MGEINLANSRGRDAIVATANVTREQVVRWLDPQGRQASSARLVKSTLQHDLHQLLESYGDLEAVGDRLLNSDPEIDLENTGRILKDTSRVYIGPDQSIVRNVRFIECVKEPGGAIKERRPRQIKETNISSDSPLQWSGVFIPKQEAVRKFVFSGKLQVQHINGLTYDFLYAMARELEERDSLMLLGGGANSSEPLILRRGGSPYRGFLEGRTRGDSYLLLLHFSNLELRLPPPAEESSPESEE